MNTLFLCLITFSQYLDKHLKITRHVTKRIVIKMHLCIILWMYFFSQWLKQMYYIYLIGHK